MTLPATPPGPGPAAKAAQTSRILGDGTGDGRVNWWDLWHLWNHLSEGYEGFTYDLDAFDINRSGEPDWIDLGMLGDYLFGSGANPHGIGRPMAAAVTASLSPHSDAVSFVADATDWKRFTVNVTGGGAVVVTVNGLSIDTVSLEILKQRSRPNRSVCPAERNDKVTVRDGDVIWIAGCSTGNSSIFIQEQDGTVLWSDVSVPVRSRYTTTTTEADDSFDIELVYMPGHFTTTQQSFIRRAADRWERIITEGIPNASVNFDSAEQDASWWDSWDIPQRVVVNETIDDIRIYAVATPLGSDSYASGGGFWVRTPSRLPILGKIEFRADAISEPEHIFVNLALHEIAHALGFGGSSWSHLELLGNPSEDDPTADTYFSGPLATAAFISVGGWRYEGLKVPVEGGGNDSHWRERVFGSEVMDPYASEYVEPLSEVTIQAMADIGYKVDYTQADSYTVPPPTKPVALADRGPRCSVNHLPPPGVQF